MMKRFFYLFIVFLMVFWVVGILRFHFPIFNMLFKIISFPSGLAYIALEDKPSAWWFDLLGTNLINDEIAQLLLFIIMVVIQALLYYLLTKLIGSK